MSLGPEGLESAKLAHWCYAWLADEVVATVFPAGGGGWRRGMELRTKGLIKDFPDWQFFWPVRQAAFIELKAGYNKPGKGQQDMLRRLRNAGYYTSVAWSVDEAIGQLRAFRVPLRITPRTDPLLQDDRIPF